MQALPRAIAACPPPGPNVILGGADAFGHTALPALVAAAIREGAVRVGLETDGGALLVGGNAAGALHAGVRHMRVRFSDADKALRGIAAWVEAARAAEVDAVATAVVTPCIHTIGEIAANVAAIAEAGAIAVQLDARVLTSAAATSAHLVAACDTGMVNGVWVEVVGSPELLPESHALHRAVGGEIS